MTAANTIFTIAVSGTGVVTLTQFAEIDHANNADTSAPYDDQFAVLGYGLVNLTASATITDGDSDTATDSATIDLGGNIRFADDGPTIDVAATSDAGVVLTTQDAQTIGVRLRGHGGFECELQRRVLDCAVRPLGRTVPGRRRC